jgi:P2 family phage contractile tail tube protein
MNIQINSLTNANIYIDGVGLLGRAEEIEIANPKHKMIDYKGLGMAGTAELWAGVEKLESKIKWASFDAETLTMSTSPFKTHSFQARGNLEQYTSQGRSAQLPVVYLMTGIFKMRAAPPFDSIRWSRPRR